jgi:hypothetical protein
MSVVSTALRRSVLRNASVALSARPALGLRTFCDAADAEPLPKDQEFEQYLLDYGESIQQVSVFVQVCKPYCY